MADAPSVAPEAPAVPVVEAPAAAPLVSEVPSLLETLAAPEAPPPSVPESPPVAPVAADAPKVDAAPEAPKAPEAEAPKVDAAPEVPKAEAAPEAPKAPEAEAPKVDAAPEAPKVPEPAPVEKVEWKFEVPPEIKVSDEQLGGLRSLLDGLVAPSETLTREQAANGLLSMHRDAMAAYAERALVEQHRQFNQTRESWRTAVMADPEIGGAGYETSARAIARMRDKFVSSARPGTDAYNDHVREFNDMLRITGAGDHPAMLRFIHNVAGAFDEPSIPAVEAKPPKTNGLPNGGKSVLYDNPRSSTGARQ